MATTPSILVIDQEAVWRHFAKMTLYETGYITETSSDYMLSSVITPDLIVLGCGRFRIQESMFTQMVRRTGSQVLVMALDGNQTPCIRSAFKSGALDVIEKPFGRVPLLEEIASSLRRLQIEPLPLINQNRSVVS